MVEESSTVQAFGASRRLGKQQGRCGREHVRLKLRAIVGQIRSHEAALPQIAMALGKNGMPVLSPVLGTLDFQRPGQGEACFRDNICA